MAKFGKPIYASENIAYRTTDALKTLIRLVVDDGTYSRGHRKNLLNPKFKL